MDDGKGERTILSGIAAYYEPEDLLGKKLLFIANLPPRKMMGIESQGMIVASEDWKTDAVRVVLIDDSVAPGSKIG